MLTVQGFAGSVVSELRQRDERAVVLQVKSKGKKAVLGIEDDGEFVPLLLLGAPTPKINKMMLFVNHEGDWQPTFHKGTPKMLAELLAGELSHTWLIAVTMMGFIPY